MIQEKNIFVTGGAGLPVVIEDDCDPGVGSIILRGVTPVRDAQVRAGAVVSESTAPYSVMAGVPARVLGSRNDS